MPCKHETRGFSLQLDRLTSLAKVLCHSMHSPLGKQMLIEAREGNGGFKMAAPYGGMLGNFVEAAIDFEWVCVE